MLDDYRMICGKLQQMQEHEDASGLYVDIIGMINKLADYVIPDGNPAKERLGEIMGGQILKLKSESLKEEGRALEIYALVQDAVLTPEFAAARLNLDIDELKKRMSHNGYRYPES